MYKQLEDTIDAQMERTALTGLAIALVRGDETVWSRGYGVANIETGEPITPETACGIMSVTKPIVGTAVMQLRDAGKFALDDPVNRYLAPVSIKNEWEDEAPVTIRQLLTHSGGLPAGVGADPPGRHPLDEYVDLAAKTSRRPGEVIVYANWGYAALGLLIERCSGKPVGDCFDNAIFAPLGMTSTTYGPPPGPRATGHFVSRLDRSIHTQPMDEWPVIPTSPAGGCWSTVLDVAEFLKAHLLGGRGILAPATVSEIHQLHAKQGSSESGMGLGFRVTRSNRRGMICHGGDGGGFTNFAGAFPDDAVGVALLINTGGMQTARSVIANTALGLLAGETPSRSFAATSIPPGLYRSTFWETDVEARDDDGLTLTTTEGLVVVEEPAESRLHAVDEGTFQAEGGMFHGFEVAFEDGDQPTITGGLYPFTFERVGEIPQPLPVDEDAQLTGEWRGTVRTPAFPLALTINIESEDKALVATPLGPATPENFRAHAGQVEFDFRITFPGVGDFHNLVRVAVRGGRLTGKTYARSQYGEIAMPTELDRA